MDDESVRPAWESDEIPPMIFIVGLHRSGTTFLYETLSQVLPVAKLTVQNVVYYRALVASYFHDGGKQDEESLTAYFDKHQTKTRGRDALTLSPATAEEYGWILKAESGSYAIGKRSLSVLKDVADKLVFVNPDTQAVLLKNPWDTGNVNTLADEFPDARFIFLRRDPLEILNSELGNLLYFTENRDPLITLLTRQATDTRISLTIARFLRVLLGRRLFSLLCIRLMSKDVANNVQKFNLSLAGAHKDRTLEITYDDLVDSPKQTLELVASFTELPVNHDVMSRISPKRRGVGLSPLVSDREKYLREQLRITDVRRLNT